MIEIIKRNFEEAKAVLERFMNDDNYAKIVLAAECIVGAIRQGGKVISCGNGGSHCDAMHFAEELTGRFRENRIPLPAIAISDPSHLSCVANDYGFEFVFSRFIEALGSPNDVLFAISTSGNSTNVINACHAAKNKSMKIIALTANNGGKLASLADIEIRAPHHGYADRAQEIHIKIIHSLIQLIEYQISTA